jgi:hypothetical protein
MNQGLSNGTVFIIISLMIRVMQAMKDEEIKVLVFFLPRLQQNYNTEMSLIKLQASE